MWKDQNLKRKKIGKGYEQKIHKKIYIKNE